MKKQKVRLTDFQAQSLGLAIKPRGNTKGNPKYFLTEEQVIKSKQLRALELTDETGIIDVARENGIPLDSFKFSWIKTDKHSVPVYNPYFQAKEKILFEENLLSRVEKASPKYPKLNRKTEIDGKLLVINPADVHIGKLALAFETGDDYNSQIAIDRVKEGVNGILNYAKGFNIEKIVFVGGNDILHIDTPRRTTTSGTPQDTDSMWYDSFMKAFDLYVELLEVLIGISDVHFVYCPSNHDYTNGFFLCQAVEKYFHKNNNITFDTSLKHRKYFTFGSNLIGFTHGDGGKVQDLPLTMAHESLDWSSCKHRYIYTHHVHHKNSKDYQSVSVESMRSPSGTDSWHSRNQFCNNIKAVEGFIHSKDFGQVARFNYIF